MEDNEITQWLVQCGVALSKAKGLAERFENEMWITEVNALKNCVECSPLFLEKLSIPFPVQQIIWSNVFVRLQDLSVSDVKKLLQISFQEDLQYGLRFHAAKINGTVLGIAKEPNDLFIWGIDNNIHAEAFFRHIGQWKEHGVAGSILQSPVIQPLVGEASIAPIGTSSSSSTSASMVHTPIASGDHGIEPAVVLQTMAQEIPPQRTPNGDAPFLSDSKQSPNHKECSVEESNDHSGTGENGSSHHSTVDTPAVQSEPVDVVPDTAFVTPKKRKPTHYTDPGPRVSPRQSIPRTIYSDTACDTSEGQAPIAFPKATPRRRSTKPVAQTSDAPVALNVKADGTNEANHTNDNTRAEPVDKKPSQGRKRRTAADFFEVGANAAIVEMVTQMHEGKVHQQIKALNALHKIVAEGATYLCACWTYTYGYSDISVSCVT